MSFLGSLSDRELEERRPVPHFRPSCLISDEGLTPEEKQIWTIFLATMLVLLCEN